VARAAPLTPDADEARELLQRELGDPAYEAAEPTALDRAARAVAEFFERLLNPDLSGGWGPATAVIATVVVVAVLVAAILIWGRPRTPARSSRHAAPLFGLDDDRSADALRSDAQAEAAGGRWEAAIVLRFRALARGLTERVIVEPPPGTTAQAFARQAARAFPGLGAQLAAAAATFDDVRYLRRPGTRALYEEVARLDDALARAAPVLQAGPPG
jgi:hypothetical protein